MSFYDFDVNIIGEKLLPPVLRQKKMLAWLAVILKPVQWLWDLSFNSFALGTSYPAWVLGAYVPTDRVQWTDKGVYECILATATIPPTGDINSSLYWVKILDNFIGGDERIKYNSQIIILEYILNKWFQIISANPQIYILVNNSNGLAFLLGNSGETSSSMANSSVFTQSYLSNSYTNLAYDFTVYFPVAVYTALGADANTREKTVRQFVDKYKLSGMNYNIITY